MILFFTAFIYSCSLISNKLKSFQFPIKFCRKYPILPIIISLSNIRWDVKWNIYAIYWLELPGLLIPGLAEFKCISGGCISFQYYIHFPTDVNAKPSRYLYVKSSRIIYCIFRPFTAKIRHFMYIGKKTSPVPHIPLIKKTPSKNHRLLEQTPKQSFFDHCKFQIYGQPISTLHIFIIYTSYLLLFHQGNLFH